ncbi:adenosine receptor A3-like [Anguilla anguilla]|uniref:adenosine receptor A3-like n=1 Tax=Anguilla anguilla TaxID=7936 RepID=UPI0015AB533E|nr:adenosine receptor A3-like [Anguilla anguilla]
MDSVAGAVYIVLELLIAVMCCLGNLLAIWAVRASGSLRKPTFCFMVSLAAADFLVGAVAIPAAVLVDGRVSTSFNSCLFLSCVEILLVQASILMLLVIAVDRHLRVQMPLRYKRSFTQRRCWAVVGACWLLAFAFSFTPMFGWYNHQTLAKMVVENSTTIVCTFLSVMPMTYMVYFQFFGCTLLPLLVMCALYVHVFRSISKRLRRSQAPGAESHAYYAKERKLAKSLLLVLVLFAIGWLPLNVMNCVTIFGGDVPLVAIYIGILLTHVNSAVNPVVYAFKVPKIRSAYLRAWRKCALCGQQGVSQSTESKDFSTRTKSIEDLTKERDYSESSRHTV